MHYGYVREHLVSLAVFRYMVDFITVYRLFDLVVFYCVLGAEKAQNLAK